MLYRTASAIALSVGSVGFGYFIGRRTDDSIKKSPLLRKNKNEESTSFVFPPSVHAKKGLTSNTPPLPTSPLPARQPDKPFDGSSPSPIGEIVKYGFPSTDCLRSYDDFVLSYDRRNRTANWVLEHLTPEKVEKQQGVERSKMKFSEDSSIHEFHRSTNKDYQNSGYDRGHLAAAANHRQSLKAMNQTFLLSNVSPQVGEGFNRDAWNNLEKYVRGIARKSKNVYVCTGPLYLPRREADGKLFVKFEVIGDNHVAVPTHFFKVVVIENDKSQMELLSFVMPNQVLPDVKLSSYLMPLEMIERASGLNFFQNIPKNTFKRINKV